MSIFKEIAKDKAEAAQLEIKGYLASLIWMEIESRGIRQAEAAKLMGVHQPRVSEIKQGRITQFSIDAMVAMLVKLGYAFDTEFTPHARKKKACISVAAGV